MLVEFKVSNFLSIREEQTLTLEASNYDDSLPHNLIEPNLPGLPGVKILKGAALYGPNASGKSNILSAFQFLKRFVVFSATKIEPGDPTGTALFALTDKTVPSRFEIQMVIEGIRYHYVLSLDEEKVRHETLTAYPRGHAVKWFERTLSPGDGTYQWTSSPSFLLDHSLVQKTRPNSLFLSTGAQWNNEQLTRVYNWFKEGLKFLDLESLSPRFTAEIIRDHKPLWETVVNLLGAADFGIQNVAVTQRDVGVEELKKRYHPAIVQDLETRGKLTPRKENIVRFMHKGEKGKAFPISIADESAGTQRFFSLVGPWLDILENGYTVFIDEIETSLHPLLVKEFLRLVFSEKTNLKGAQIIFTTHNPLLLDTDLIRRDQVWFTEKTDEGATRLYPLYDYKPRKDESLQRGYLAGRYGAVPFIPHNLGL
jgi:hypothetical protein